MSAALRRLEAQTLLEREQRMSGVRGAELPRCYEWKPKKHTSRKGRHQKVVEKRQALMVALFAGEIEEAKTIAASIPPHYHEDISAKLVRCGLKWPL